MQCFWVATCVAETADAFSFHTQLLNIYEPISAILTDVSIPISLEEAHQSAVRSAW